MREAEIKSELIQYLRSHDLVRRGATFASELAIGRQSNRVDLTLVDDQIHHFEIKTAFDSLIRLDRQIGAYVKCADFVTIVVSTKHINSAISRVPEEVGILEVVSFDAENLIREVRPASLSPYIEKTSLLEIMPVEEIRVRFGLDGRSIRRSQVNELLSSVTELEVKKGLVDFLHGRYGGNTRSLLRKARSRKVRPSDLNTLRKWDNKKNNDGGSNGIESGTIDLDHKIYSEIGKSFGPVPEEIRKSLKG